MRILHLYKNLTNSITLLISDLISQNARRTFKALHPLIPPKTLGGGELSQLCFYSYIYVYIFSLQGCLQNTYKIFRSPSSSHLSLTSRYFIRYFLLYSTWYQSISLLDPLSNFLQSWLFPLNDCQLIFRGLLKSWIRIREMARSFRSRRATLTIMVILSTSRVPNFQVCS